MRDALGNRVLVVATAGSVKVRVPLGKFNQARLLLHRAGVGYHADCTVVEGLVTLDLNPDEDVALVQAVLDSVD